MLSFNTTNRLNTTNQGIAKSQVIRLQGAFLSRLRQENDKLSSMFGVPLSTLQEIALAPKISGGELLTSEDFPKLVELMHEAYTCYVAAYTAAGFPHPVSAALQAMASYEVVCT
jgi:hypothetical protein